MSDPVNSRPNGEPRLPIDLDDIERRLRDSLEPVPVPVPPPAYGAAPAPQKASHDPLAELARLVGGSGNSDPFSKVFASPSGLSAPPPSTRTPPPLDPPPLSLSPAYASTYVPKPVSAPVVESAPDHADQQQGQSFQMAQDEAAPWIGQQQQEPDTGAYEESQEPPRRKGRARLLIGAAVVIATGGLAAALMLRGGPSGDTPTILANSGPVKIQPAQPAEDTSRPNISVLERGANAQRGSKVVQSEEQPVDLGTAARNAAGQRSARTGEAGAPVTLAPPPPPPVANSLFAEPKKVKAVAVRPDGTIIDSSPAPATAPAKPADKPAAPEVRAEARTEAKPEIRPAPAPVPPPRPAAGPPMNIVAAAPAATAPVVPATPAAPAAPPVATSAVTAGTYAVQLVGTTSSDEAKAALERVNTKYRSELGSYRPTIVKAEDGDRTVYRVRVINLSSDDANRLCARLKASGGTCFVARS